MSRSPSEPAQYLNVDLEIWSFHDLQKLLGYLSKQTVLLNHPRRGRTWFASLELLSQRPRDADQAIRLFVKILGRLPSLPRRQWDAARRRTFNIGVQAGSVRPPLELEVQPQTLQAVAALGAGLAITVYPPARPMKLQKRRLVPPSNS